MQPVTGYKTKFKLNPRYPHKRSDGLTARQNGGTRAVDRSGRALSWADTEELHTVNVENAVAGYVARKAA